MNKYEYGRSFAPAAARQKKIGALTLIRSRAAGITGVLCGAVAAAVAGEKVINPVFNSGVAGCTSSPTAKPGDRRIRSGNCSRCPVAHGIRGTQQEQITARAVTLYALQSAVFSDESNAKKIAQDVKTRGGAGFISYDGSLYRVLLAGYTSENDAKSVKADLEEQNISTTIFKLDSGAPEFKIGAEKQQIEAVKACFGIVPTIVSELQQIIFDADRGSNVDDRITALKAKADEVNANLKSAVSAESASMASLIEYMDSLCGKLSTIPKSTEVSGVAFSSELKYNLIGVVVDYAAFFKKLSS